MRIFVLAFLFLSGGSVLAARPDSLAVSRGGELRDSVSATSQADTAGKGFDALEYSLQKRHIFRGRPFVAGRFTDNTFMYNFAFSHIQSILESRGCFNPEKPVILPETAPTFIGLSK